MNELIRNPEPRPVGFTGKWVVDVKGTAERACEISVIREDNGHGFKSYGWFKDDEKLVVLGSGGPCDYSYHPFIFEAAKQAAQVLANRLNSEETKTGS